ncbi:MAG: methyltransferase domain-containing protein [Spirochaetales bacterium]|nr:methyltransferase domain-containing protein [Spirochaetales bacterium]
MQEKILTFLQCPECKGDIRINKIIEKKIINNKELLIAALLQCNGCNELFPIIDGIPRLLEKDKLMEFEKLKVVEYKKTDNKILIREEKELIKKEKYTLIEKKLRQLFKPENAVSFSMRNRIERDIDYRVFHSDKKEKFLETTKLYYHREMKSILEVGGGQGGTISCFKNYYQPDIVILIDIDSVMSEISQIRDPFINTIRADGINIPVKNSCIDFIITTATLEHIKKWKKCIQAVAF